MLAVIFLKYHHIKSFKRIQHPQFLFYKSISDFKTFYLKRIIFSLCYKIVLFHASPPLLKYRNNIKK